jgi:hypothetical protein
MACHPLGIQTQAELDRSPFLGAIYEGFVAAEILKCQINRGQRKELYCFRDRQGLEVDFLVPQPNAKFWLVEAKASRTVQSTMANPLLALKKSCGRSRQPLSDRPPQSSHPAQYDHRSPRRRSHARRAVLRTDQRVTHKKQEARHCGKPLAFRIAGKS